MHARPLRPFYANTQKHIPFNGIAQRHVAYPCRTGVESTANHCKLVTCRSWGCSNARKEGDSERDCQSCMAIVTSKVSIAKLTMPITLTGGMVR